MEASRSAFLRSLWSFFRVLCWEFLQNLPVLAGFAWALAFWQAGWVWAALACILAGALAAAVLIALTEARKQPGYREPPLVVLANIAGMSLFMFLLVLYLSARWSGYSTDLLVGLLCGAGLGLLQGLAARKQLNWVHILALGLASPLVLALFRWMLAAAWSTWLTILLMNLLATLVISLVDYAQDEFGPKETVKSP